MNRTVRLLKRCMTGHAIARYYSKAAPEHRIHVLGVGNLGRFIAHSLRKSHPNLPITLLFHRPSLVGEWGKSGHCIEITTNDIRDRETGFDTEVIGKLEEQSLKFDGNEDPISNLVIATKAHATKAALGLVARRIDSKSTLLFTQNGMGNISKQ
jgi:2-dehydropantoate 2-reductase